MQRFSTKGFHVGCAVESFYRGWVSRGNACQSRELQDRHLSRRVGVAGRSTTCGCKDPSLRTTGVKSIDC